MKKISLFIAMSLDGYIADSKGSVEWLTGQGNDEDNIDSYSEFVKDIDTVVMGWNTYHQIVTELSPEDWVYDDFTTYVVTHKQKKSSDKIHFVNKNPVELIKELRKENGNGIWICGGANLIQQLVRADIIDCYYITVIPTILGSGIRLFEKADHEWHDGFNLCKKINPSLRGKAYGKIDSNGDLYNSCSCIGWL